MQPIERREATMSGLGCNLKNHFLIAMPQLADINFSGTLIFICDHDEKGALGLVVNQPSQLELSDICAQLNVDLKATDQPIYYGGPVECERGFVLHNADPRWHGSLMISPEIALSTSRELLQDIALGRGPAQTLITLGYAGWGEGQLEQEMSDNAWLSCQADPDILFNTPDEKKLQRAMQSLGVDAGRLSHQSGHA
jgi:putative transcriptional regulator